MSLFFNPAHQATFWSRYEFTTGLLDNFAFGVGATYSGAAPTAVSIGGEEVGKNLFPTPNTAANWNFNAGLYYSFKLGRTRWNLRLNISNLFDDRMDTTTISYHDDFNDRTVTKRSEVFRMPRSFRFTASVGF